MKYISIEEITPEDITKRGDPTKDAAFIQVNLDTLLKKIEPGKLPASGNYHAALQTRIAAPNLTEEMVTANFDKLFGAYLEVIKNKTYFLRQEDLLSLADMKNEGLVIYREHDIEPQRVIEAVSHHPERATVKRVFHQGVHYQHAELKDIQKQ